jgi:hypothetical protein
VRSPEGRSSSNILLPDVAPATLDCGTHGGVIQAVTFASWGRPRGQCGDEASQASDATCHHPESMARVQRLCLGHTACHIPSHADYWGTMPGCGRPDEARVLFVQAVCSSPATVRATVAVPVGLRAQLTLPTYDPARAPNVSFVTESEVPLTAVPEVAVTPAVVHAESGPALVLEMGSGHYDFLYSPS